MMDEKDDLSSDVAQALPVSTTHDALLAQIDAWNQEDDYPILGLNALRAVVELHKPIELNVGDEFHYEGCLQCDRQYPCPTIKAIEKELK